VGAGGFQLEPQLAVDGHQSPVLGDPRDEAADQVAGLRSEPNYGRNGGSRPRPEHDLTAWSTHLRRREKLEENPQKRGAQDENVPVRHPSPHISP